jgi:hypothetical protein
MVDDAGHNEGAQPMEIGDWLRSLGLGKYEAAFRENEIDETVLPSLTEEHLKQLGGDAVDQHPDLAFAKSVQRKGSDVMVKHSGTG